MKWLNALWVDLKNFFTPAHDAAPDVRMSAKNLTRQNLLAANVELANTSEKRRTGLLGRAALAPGEALWINPCESVHTFWMQFAIDVVYLDRQHRIRKISYNLRPWRLSACFSAHSVLELAAGSLRESGAKPGDIIEFCPISDFSEAAPPTV